MLLLPVLVELLEKVLVLVLGGGGVRLILHLEHDGHNLRSGIILVAEDEVALAARPGIVVLLEVGIGKSRGSQLVELDLAMLLKRLPHHLGGQLRLQITQPLNLIVTILDLDLITLLERLGLDLALQLRLVQAALQFRYLGILVRDDRLQLRLQLLLGELLLRLLLKLQPLKPALEIIPLLLHRAQSLGKLLLLLQPKGIQLTLQFDDLGLFIGLPSGRVCCLYYIANTYKSLLQNRLIDECFKPRKLNKGIC